VELSKEELQKLLKKELQKYSSDKNSFKDYFQSMKELNEWLSKMEK